MSTPLLSAVERYIRKGSARFHMPGHKGAWTPPVGGAALYDITEVAGADSLYESAGAIAQTEARYAALYGTAGTLLSAGGSTLCIQAMLALAARPGAQIICARGAHTAAINAMALLGLTPVWVWPETDARTGLALPVTAQQVQQALAACPEAAAVYLTSPNYFGMLTDVAAVSAVCRAQGVPLLVDNAHGAHLRFLQPDLHPITQGADLCCDSLHKTLPVLTGGALLHIGAPELLPDAKRCMSLFGSTSPSYLILLSIDTALPYLEPEAQEAVPSARRELAEISAKISALRRAAAAHGFLLPPGPCDPIRLALGFTPTGLPAAGLRAHLDRCGIEPEYISESFCVFLAGGETSDQDYTRLEHAIATVPYTKRIPELAYTLPEPPQQACTLREAVLAPAEAVPAGRAAGRICAGAVSPCPPGIPLVLPGELLDDAMCCRLKKSGILSVNVIK